MRVFDVEAYLNGFSADARSAGFEVFEFGRIKGMPLILALRTGKSPSTGIYISAGIHGDEPAGPLSLGKMMREGCFADGVSWTLIPLLNPLGMRAGTRESGDGIDLNRDYREPVSEEIRAHKAWLESQAENYDLTINLHEDWEAKGFYLYEMCESGEYFGPDILKEVGKVGAVDMSSEIDGSPAIKGLIVPDETHLAELEDSWPEQVYLQKFYTRHSLNMETASGQPLEKRIEAHVCAIKTAVESVSR